MRSFYPNCIPVQGAKNIAFYDLEKQKLKRFYKPDLLLSNDGVVPTAFDLQNIHENGLKLLEHHQLMMQKEDIHLLRSIQPSNFYRWKTPSFITNAVIELSQENGLLITGKFENLLTCIEKLRCKHVLLKVTTRVDPTHLKHLIDLIHHSFIHSVQLVLPFQEELYTDDFGSFIMNQPKIKCLIVESAPFKKNLEDKIFFYEHQLKSSIDKKPEQFITNLFLFSESQLHHTYFNRKLFVGANGEIKNAPECNETVGLIQNMEQPQQLIDLVKTSVFQKYWYVTKERCEVCKDCEFRHACIDNRVPHQRENGYWYHLEECNYDPYTGSWKSEAKPPA